MTTYKVTGTAHDGIKVVRVPPRFFFVAIEAFDHIKYEMETGTLWIKNEEGSRNVWSVVETKSIKWPKGARA